MALTKETTRTLAAYYLDRMSPIKVYRIAELLDVPTWIDGPRPLVGMFIDITNRIIDLDNKQQHKLLRLLEHESLKSTADKPKTLHDDLAAAKQLMYQMEAKKNESKN